MGHTWLIGIIIWEMTFYSSIYYITKEMVFFEACTGFVCQSMSLDITPTSTHDHA